MREFKTTHMIREVLFLLICTGLISCGSKVQNENFVPEFAASHLRSHIVYNHKYDGERLSKTYETMNIYVNGQVVYSSVTIREFKYTEKGLLEEEKIYIDTGELYSTKIYKHNPLDSLVEQIEINSGNDTIFWEKYNYFPDGKRLTFRRVKGTDLNIDASNKKIPSSDNLIILFYERHDYIYNEDQCKKQITYSQNGDAMKYVDFKYDDYGKLMIEIHTQIFDKLELTEKTKHYDYTESHEFPDFYTLDASNNRIEQLHYEFKGEGIMVETRSFDYGSSITQTIYENGKEVGILSIEKNPDLMVYHSIVYNERGDIKEDFTYWKE